METLAVCVPGHSVDCYGHHTRHAVQLASAAAKRGMRTEILKQSEPDFIERLVHVIGLENCVVYFYCYQYDLLTRLAVHDVRAATVAMLSDHPFSHFIRGMIPHAHPKTQFLLIDDTFADEMVFLNPALSRQRFQHVPIAPFVNYDPLLEKPFANRDIDLVVPLFLADMSDRSFGAVIANWPSNWLTRAAAAAYQVVLNNIACNPFHVLDEQVGRETGGATLAQIREHIPKAVPVIIDVLNALDMLARQERRHLVLTNLLADVGDLKVVVLGDCPRSLKVDQRVAFVGRQDVFPAAALMGNSRAILNCSPSYPHNIHERISVGMLYASCVITDVNPCLEQTVPPDSYLAYEPTSPSMSIKNIFAQHDVRGIAELGHDRVSGDPRFNWNGYLDQVLEAAKRSACATESCNLHASHGVQLLGGVAASRLHS